LGKVITMRIQSILFLVIVVLSVGCISRKRDETKLDEQVVTIDTSAITEEREYPSAVEFIEYRSQLLNGYELYAIHPENDNPIFLVSRNGKVRLLVLNEEREVDEGIALEDEEFTAIKLLQERGTIGPFDEIVLVTRAGLEPSFTPSQTKRALTIAPLHTTANSTGELTLGQPGDVFNFSVTTADNPTCNTKGILAYKGNLGYYNGLPQGNTCKLVFVFGTEKTYVFVPSANTNCCNGKNSLSGEYFAKKINSPVFLKSLPAN
jgi:hypothetical protein